MQIHQLNIQYQADQDRVLARINTSAGTELRLWLTRRLTLGLLPILRRVESEQLQKSLAAQPEADLGMTANDPKVREMLIRSRRSATIQYHPPSLRKLGSDHSDLRPRLLNRSLVGPLGSPGCIHVAV